MTTPLDERIANLDDETALPRKNGELVFAAPWEGRAFGMAVALTDQRHDDWEAFRARLIAEIAAADACGAASGYYEQWLAAFESLLVARGVVTKEELDTRTAEYEAGLRDDHEHGYATAEWDDVQLAQVPSSARPHNLVRRADGKAINVFQRPGLLFVCATGCCCGQTERGFAPVPTEQYHHEWERRRIRNKVHLSIGGCLGPCALANVLLLIYDAHEIWFHSVAGEAQVVAIYDYIETMVDAGRYLPPPASLAPHVFRVFGWSRPEASAETVMPANGAARIVSGIAAQTRPSIAIDAASER